MRRHTKIIVWSVIIAFVLWGGYSLGVSLSQSGKNAGEIFGKGVSFTDFDRFYRASQIFSFNGKSVQDPELLKQQTWQSIIYSREAKRLNVPVSDQEVHNEIARLLKTQGIENATPELYKAWLSRTLREAPKDFEEQIRELLRIQKLVLTVSQVDGPEPTAEEAKQRFLLDSQTLTLEAVQFPTLQEAETFYKDHKNSKDWLEAAEKNEFKPVPLQSQSLWQLMNTLNISETDTQSLFKLSAGDISKPIATGNTFTVFRVLDKKAASLNQFTEEEQKKYISNLLKERKLRRFIEWHTEVVQRANLKDFLPRSEQTTQPIESATESVTPPTPAK